MPHNIFVLGLDEPNLELLRRLPGAHDYRFHRLLDVEGMRIGEADYDESLEQARAQLDAFDGPIDAVTGYWDFPVTSLTPVLCERYGLPSTSLESIAKCEHKYWSRLEQREVIDEYPAFAVVDPDTDTALPQGLDYPVWLKPVKSASSKLAFHIDDESQFTEALSAIREEIGDVSGPFDAVLNRLDVPPAVAEAGSRACIAEEAVGGAQVTVEGYRYHHEPHVYGVVDSVNYPGTSSFLRYQYPSTLPRHLTDRVSDISKRVAVQMGLRSTTFDIEFFIDLDTERIWVLEVNPRLSQSHAQLFEHVDGVANHHCMVSLALGRDPDMPHRQGRYATAGKWFLRRFTDGVVRRAPTAEEIARVEEDIPGVTVQVVTKEGVRLSEQYERDSYSFELADIMVGANDEDELKKKYERCVAALPFEFDDD
ncbi:ATP-grasp domain-containing protein [Prauserella muralis]|uniref:Biotin carboxylase n=1 Tax=Prauserella muralis TaxID=588067 RepID=A0A2V4AGI3_9PSEU|nr:ATP-grasp domain-containing protein [Prauserella muralis]PXY19034.1 biotin carboxylase [Prauserella muralis]TWE28928.1 ATP-grasp domain-containing protein [Prauserella muralis]